MLLQPVCSYHIMAIISCSTCHTIMLTSIGCPSVVRRGSAQELLPSSDSTLRESLYHLLPSPQLHTLGGCSSLAASLLITKATALEHDGRSLPSAHAPSVPAAFQRHTLGGCWCLAGPHLPIPFPLKEVAAPFWKVACCPATHKEYTPCKYHRPCSQSILEAF